MLKNKMNKLAVLTVFSLVSVSSAFAAYAEDESESLKVTGQVRSRTEMDARSFNSSASPLFFTSLRTTLGVEKSFMNKVKFFIQARDSRIMGEEPNNAANIKNLDLHQGYVLLKDPCELPLSLQLGRFEMNYGTQRFIGAGDWGYNGRSFDGVKLNFSNKDAMNFGADLFAFVNTTPSKYSYKDASGTDVISNYIGGPSANIYKNLVPQGEEMYGFWTGLTFAPNNDIALIGFYQNNKKQTKPTFSDLKLGTLGLTYNANIGDLFSTFEAGYQMGNAQDLSVNAYLVSEQLAYAFGDFKLGVGADILSGNAPDSKTTKNVFITGFGTNHKFYGGMDYFTNIPVDTKNLGLNDFYLSTSWKNTQSPLAISLDLHQMMSNQTPAGGGDNTYGQEVDLILNHKIMDKTNVILGASAFVPGKLMQSDSFWGKDANGLGYWSYLTLVTGF